MRTSAVNGQVTLQTLWVFYLPLHWLSLLHFSYWDFSTSSQFSLFGQNITVSSDCWARWPGQLFMPASCNFCHWWTLLPHPSSVFTSPVSLILWLEFSLSQWPVWFFPIWYWKCSAFSRQKLENNYENHLKKEVAAPKQMTIGHTHVISLTSFLFLVRTLELPSSCKYHNRENKEIRIIQHWVN